jgi:hypothetical protein
MACRRSPTRSTGSPAEKSEPQIMSQRRIKQKALFRTKREVRLFYRPGLLIKDSRGRVYEVQETGAWKRVGIEGRRGSAQE